MEFLVASAIAVLTASGTFLLLRSQTFSIVLGLTMLTYAVNLFLFSSGRLAVSQPDIVVDPGGTYADPLPQALVLTSIVISFGMSALILVMAVRSYFETGGDEVDLFNTEELVAKDRR